MRIPLPSLSLALCRPVYPQAARARPGISHSPPKVGQKEDLFLSIFSSFLISAISAFAFLADISRRRRATCSARHPIPHPEANFMTCRGNPRSFSLSLSWAGPYTGLDNKAIPRLRECCGQVEAEVVSNCRNKIHQTWERPWSQALYI